MGRKRKHGGGGDGCKKKGKGSSLVARAKLLRQQSHMRGKDISVLKRKEEAWVQVRNKYQRSIARIPYLPQMDTLLVGEGNFSFARALTRHFQRLREKRERRQAKWEAKKEDEASATTATNTGKGSADDAAVDTEKAAKALEDAVYLAQMPATVYSTTSVAGLKKARRLAARAGRPAGEGDAAEGEVEWLREDGAPVLLPGERLVATSYDTLEEVREKYNDFDAIAEEVRAAGGAVVHGVDGTPLHTNIELLTQLLPKTASRKFDKIVFNFPHTACGIKDTAENNRVHQRFLAAFFQSAVHLVKDTPLEVKKKKKAPIPTPKGKKNKKKKKQAAAAAAAAAAAQQSLGSVQHGGEIHVTLKKGEPYDSWNIKRIARTAHCGIRLKTAFDFYHTMYDGYEHRRTLGGLEELLEERSDDGQTGKKGKKNRKNPTGTQNNVHDQEKVQPNKDIKKFGARTWVFVKTNADPNDDDSTNAI